MKKLPRFLIVLAVLFVVTLVVGVLFLDRAIVVAVEKGGTYALGVETKLEKAHLGFGTMSLTSLEVANPPGFSEPRFLALGSGRLEVETGSVLSDKIVAPILELSEVSVDLERGRDGTNYGVILKNLERLQAKPGGKEGGARPLPEETGSSKTVRVEKIRIRNVAARVDLLGAAPITVRIPEIVVDHLDTSEMSVADMVSLLVRTLLTSVVQSGAGVLPDDLLKDLGGQLGNVGTVALQISGDVVKNVSGELQKAAEGLGEAGKQVGEAAGETLEKAGESLKGILKKKP
jgi:hypothetical protein